MRKISSLLCLGFFVISFNLAVKAQSFSSQKDASLPTYKAKQVLEMSDAQYEEANAGCSWYCGAPDIIVSASSFLPHSKGGINYKPSNVHDFRLKTAWAEGKPGDGIGAKLNFDFVMKGVDNQNLTVEGLTIVNGYRKSRQLWKDNSRIKKLKMYIDNKPYAIIELADAYGFQGIDFGKVKLTSNVNRRISFEITEVYKGDKYSDTVLSQIEFYGSGVH